MFVIIKQASRQEMLVSLYIYRYLDTLITELQMHEWTQLHVPAAYLPELFVHFIIYFLSLCVREREAPTACRFSRVFFLPGAKQGS